VSEIVSYKSAGGIARITMDDGKVNVMSPSMLRGLHAAFERAEKEKAIVILTGRDKIFSAGFDLNVFARGVMQENYEMLLLGAELAHRVLTFPLPVVAACTGHALPMGAFLMLGSDVRIGADGPFRIGLNEVAINLTIPHFAVELARGRLNSPHFHLGLATGRMFDPREAVEAGFLDRVVPAGDLQSAADQVAESLSKINFESHAATKLRLREPWVKAVRAGIDREITFEAYQRRFAQRPAA